jgi:opacity protein-like surface antigen
MTSRLRAMSVVAGMALASVALATAAHAQAPAPATSAVPSNGYAEVVAQSAFGNVTSQSFGGEIGFNVTPDVEIFLDAGLVRDAAPSTLGANAQKIAAGVSALAGGADLHVKEPVTFGVAGVKFLIPTNNRVAPYVLVGAGLAQAKKDVTITPATGTLNQFVTLGDDLSGSETKPMISAGVGVGVPLGRMLIVDFQYRYGRVFTSNEGINVNRAGLGFGVRF